MENNEANFDKSKVEDMSKTMIDIIEFICESKCDNKRIIEYIDKNINDVNKLKSCKFLFNSSPKFKEVVKYIDEKIKGLKS